MQNRRTRSIILILGLLLAASLTACEPSSGSQAEPQSDKQTEASGAGDAIWQYKMTISTNFGRSDALLEQGTVIFDGTFSVLPNGVIESLGGRVTVSGKYSCREFNSDPPRILEGTLAGEHAFVVEGSLIDAKDYDEFGIIPLEPLTADVLPAEYALISMPKVSDRTPITVSFDREKCTASDFTPVIAEVVSYGEIPFFSGDYIPFFVVALDSQAAFKEQITLNDEGSQVLSEAKVCVAPSGLCP